MNVFRLDEDPDKAAKMHCDKHVNKMLLEGVQIISTTLQQNGYKHEKLYNQTHQKHPIVIWAGESRKNIQYIKQLCEALHEQWRERFNHKKTETHKSYEVLQSINFNEALQHLPDKTQTTQPVAAPEKYQKLNTDTVTKYRTYYANEKHFAKWEKGVHKPAWFEKLRYKGVDTPQ